MRRLSTVDGPELLNAQVRPAPGSPAPVIVTLIHGTFAQDAAWTRSGSPLRRAIRARFGKAAQFEVFPWTGRNSHRDRKRAGDRLRVFLATSAQAVPNARRVLVAHSHGGNVALYAVGEPGPLLDASGRPVPRIDAVVALGTPFISCTPRNIAGSAAVLWLTGLLTAATWGTFVLIAIGTLLSLPVSAGLEFVLGLQRHTAAVAAVLTVAVVSVGAWHSRGRPTLTRNGIRTRIEAAQAETLNRLALPGVSRVRLLCVKVPGDEARDLLSGLGALANVPYYMWAVVRRVAGWFAAPRAVGLLAVLAIVVAAFGGSLPPATEAQPAARWFVTAGTYVLRIFFWLYLVIAPSLVLAMAGLPTVLRWLAFGSEGAADNLYCRISGEPVPDSALRVAVRTFSPPALGAGGGAARWSETAGLRHALYAQRDVVKAVARWMCKVVP